MVRSIATRMPYGERTTRLNGAVQLLANRLSSQPIQAGILKSRRDFVVFSANVQWPRRAPPPLPIPEWNTVNWDAVNKRFEAARG